MILHIELTYRIGNWVIDDVDMNNISLCQFGFVQFVDLLIKQRGQLHTCSHAHVYTNNSSNRCTYIVLFSSVILNMQGQYSDVKTILHIVRVLERRKKNIYTNNFPTMKPVSQNTHSEYYKEANIDRNKCSSQQTY